MRYRSLGRSGLLVSELGLGTMTFGDAEGLFRPVSGVDQGLAEQIVSRSIEAGVNYFDTADAYGAGQSERILGTAFRNLGIKRSDVVIATKGYGRMGPGPNDWAASRGHLMDAVKASLERLGVDYIDHYQIHQFDTLTPIEETLRALDDLVSQGLVRYVGCSNWAAWQVMKSIGLCERYGWARLETVQAYYSLVGRDIERELVPMMTDQRVGLIVWSPLAGGLLTDKFANSASPEGRRSKISFPPIDTPRAEACIEALRAIAESHGATLAQAAIAWLLSKPIVSSILIGVKTMAQLEDNLAAATLSLTPSEVEQLDEISALTPEYPTWMPYKR